ncbi:lytic transglycosylase domain-containing protein [Puia sp. P3]|uniref:lytic transglycosylase domain-containing protein n=1 Tax=Puia sp. P3 TaxID=3423952 RepID=UPI003D66D3AF
MVKEFNRRFFTGISFLFIMPFAIGSGSSHSVDRSTERMYLDKHSKEFVLRYVQSNTPTLFSIKQKSHLPFIIADSIFRQYDLPSSLKYLAVVESELNPNAVSRVGAVGAWQLMPATARMLGLRVGQGVDERTLYNKSTRAAARYLRDLYAQFGNWLLVLAAYNSGEGTVNRAIRLSGSRNFWELQSFLPAESRMYVKKFVASYYYFEGQNDEVSGGLAANVPHQASLGDRQ